MTFIKKELLRVFTDKKLIISLFIMPIVLLIGLFGLMGYLMKNMQEDISMHIGNVYIQNAPNEFQEFCKTIDLSDFNINYINSSQDTTSIKQDIKNGNVDLLIVFEDNFIEKIKNYMNEESLPQIKTFYNISEDYSSATRRDYLSKVITPFRTTLLAERFGNVNTAEVFSIDSDNQEAIIQDDNKASGKLLGMMVPYMITILLFSSVMGVGMDAIAGEKERGTVATMLLTPISRRNIIMGKLIGLTIVSLLSALVYIISASIGTPLLMSSVGEELNLSINYSFVQILQMLVIILVMATNYVGIVALVSSLCKNVKEATTYIMPAYMFVIASGVFTMLGNKEPELFHFLIPIYNCSLVLKNIFIMEITNVQFFTTIAASLGLTAILVIAMTKIFESERIMFNS